MLVLTRRVNEEIVFPDLGITVRVLEHRGNAVRVGIEAPKTVTILRAELMATPSTIESNRPIYD